MKKKLTKKEKKFIEDFIDLYIEKTELKSAKDKKKLKEINKKIKLILKDYPVLFRDICVLYKIFNKVARKKKILLLDKDFELFLGSIFEDLYKQKIISRKDFDNLNNWLTKFNITPRVLKLYELGGVGLN